MGVTSHSFGREIIGQTHELNQTWRWGYTSTSRNAASVDFRGQEWDHEGRLWTSGL